MFLGWKLSLLSMGSNFMIQGTILYCMNAFLEPLCQINDWTRAEITISMSLGALVGQLAMPLAASLASRFSLRHLMVVGAVIASAATLGLGYASDIILFTVFLSIAWVSSHICGGVVGNALMSNWFYHARGRAFGLANAGISFSGVILPLLSMFLINQFSVSTAYTILALMTLCLAPLSWILVRDTPQEMHLFPDGRRHGPWISKKEQKHEISFHDMLRTPAGYYIGIAFGLAFMVGTATMSQMKPRFSGLGMDAYPAMLLACTAALFATVAKYIWGWVCDRFTPLIAMRVVISSCILSMGLGFFPPSVWNMCFFSILFGVSIGGMWTVFPAMVTYYFGAKNFLPAFKFVSIFIVLRSLGYPVLGYSYDLTGSYRAADIIFLCLLGTSLLLSFILRAERAVEGRSRHHLS
jgi:OFA family oxalate/formate antiporter-like MFS transporter